MGGLAGFLALGITLVAGLVFALGGAALAAATLQRLPRRDPAPLPFRPLWKIATLAFLAGLVLGGVLKWLGGNMAPSLIGLPLYLLLFSLMLRRRFPVAYGEAAWWLAPLHALVATMASYLVFVILTLGISALFKA